MKTKLAKGGMTLLHLITTRPSFLRYVRIPQRRMREKYKMKIKRLTNYK